ncbi:MAG: hypothetical protein KTR22_12470 [Flavobacteriaceae bacterium]|nr:hypothetical protein [Flavobacteriaceae bacterium]
MDRYPEIAALQKWIHEQDVAVTRMQASIHAELISVSLTVSNEVVVLQIMDEYCDLEKNSTLLTVILCLRELELIDDSKDYENWCRFQNIEGTTEAEAYYLAMKERLPTLKPFFPNGELDSFISDLDFQLNAGAIQELRK